MRYRRLAQATSLALPFLSAHGSYRRMSRRQYPKDSRRSNWSDIQFVIAAAKHGSFYSAALFLDTNQSTVGRRVQRLEAFLGTKIFERHAAGMRLTAAGKVLLDKALLMEHAALDLESSLHAFDSRLSGSVRISLTEGVAYMWLVSVLADFCRLHPGVDIDLSTDKQTQELLALNADIAVFIERPKNPSLVASKLAKLEHSLFISAEYEAKFGRPVHLDDLAQHHFVDYKPYSICAGLKWWTKKVTSSHRVRLRAESASVYLAAIRSGMGIGLLPNFYKCAAKDLIPLTLPTNCNINLWLVSRQISNETHRTKVLLNYLRDRFKRDRSSWFEV